MSRDRLLLLLSELRPERPARLPESLTAAASDGDVETMALFLERGADLEERSAGFASPLAAACAQGRLEAIRFLLAKGARVHVADAPVPPLRACFMGRVRLEAAEMLLDAGAPLEEAAVGVLCAAGAGNLQAVRRLLARGLDLDRVYPGVGTLRRSALAAAEKASSPTLVTLLRGEGGTYGPDGDAPEVSVVPEGRGNETPVATGARRSLKLKEATALLRAAGAAALKWTGEHREPILGVVAGHGVTEIVQVLVDLGADPNACADPKQPRPLYRAAEGAHLEVMRLLLARGAEPTSADGKSWLPLQAALVAGVPEGVRLLLEAGANPKARPAGGPPLPEWARGPYRQELQALLSEAVSRPKARYR